MNQSRAGVKPTITRVVKSAPSSKIATPEQKIAALTRQGNLKITRKVINAPISAQSIALQGGEEFNLNEPFSANIDSKIEPQDQHMPLVATQISLGPVDASNSSVALIETAQMEANVNEIKKESEDIVMSEDQIQQLHQSGGIVTDQDGIQQILAANEDGSQQLIQFVTGEDGTIYQVAGKNEQGQTVLIAQGADGEQQCVYVAAEDSEALGLDEANNGVLSIDGNLVETNTEVQQQLHQQLVSDGQHSIQFSIGTDESTAVQNIHQPLAVATEDGDSQDGQITAVITNKITNVKLIKQTNFCLFFFFQFFDVVTVAVNAGSCSSRFTITR